MAAGRGVRVCGISMPGMIPNNQVSLPKWRKPLGKLEAVKTDDFQVIVGGNGLPCCLILFTASCAFFMACSLDKGASGKDGPTRSDVPIPDWSYYKNISWQQGGLTKMPMPDFYT